MTSQTGAAQRIVDRVVGKAKKIAGSISSDSALRHEGELHEQKADAALEAERLEAASERATAIAEVSEKERRLALEEQELRNDQIAEARETLHEQEIVREEARIESELERSTQRAEMRETSTEAALERTESVAATERAQDLRSASVAEDEARRAERRAEAYEDAAESK